MPTAPSTILANTHLLKELKLIRAIPSNSQLYCESVSSCAFCPHCGEESRSIYDHRTVRYKDIPLGPERPPTTLILRKKRFFCRPCGKVFSETVSGFLPRQRSSERFKSLIRWACERFSNLSQVSKDYKVCNSSRFHALNFGSLMP